jgi:hypothetical protein
LSGWGGCLELGEKKGDLTDIKGLTARSVVQYVVEILVYTSL